jgi:hypothetical protein
MAYDFLTFTWQQAEIARLVKTSRWNPTDLAGHLLGGQFRCVERGRSTRIRRRKFKLEVPAKSNEVKKLALLLKSSIAMMLN